MSRPSLDEIIRQVKICLSVIAPNAGTDEDLTIAFVQADKGHQKNPSSPDLISRFIMCLRKKFKVPFPLSPAELLSTSISAPDTVRRIAKRIHGSF
jgi:hypothetical protein